MEQGASPGLDSKRPGSDYSTAAASELLPLIRQALNEMDPKELREVIRRALGDTACRTLGLTEISPEVKLSVVVPVYNEHATIREILRRTEAVPIRKEIIVVDDYSTDGTREILQEIAAEDRGKAEETAGPLNTIHVLFHEQNRGKGATLRTGFAQITGTIVIVQDADLEYNPAEYPQLIEPIIDGRADVVYGSRFIGETHRVLYFWHYFGNRVLTTLSNMFTGLNLTDMETCYKVFRRGVIDEIAPTLKSNRFGFEPEVTAKIAKRGLRVYELPISYSGREYSEGKKITWKDAIQAFWFIVRYRVAD